MGHEWKNLHNLIEVDRNYPVGIPRDSRLLDVALKAAGIKQEDDKRRIESGDEKK